MSVYLFLYTYKLQIFKLCFTLLKTTKSLVVIIIIKIIIIIIIMITIITIILIITLQLLKFYKVIHRLVELVNQYSTLC